MCAVLPLRRASMCAVLPCAPCFHVHVESLCDLQILEIESKYVYHSNDVLHPIEFIIDWFVSSLLPGSNLYVLWLHLLWSPCVCVSVPWHIVSYKTRRIYTHIQYYVPLLLLLLFGDVRSQQAAADDLSCFVHPGVSNVPNHRGQSPRDKSVCQGSDG